MNTTEEALCTEEVRKMLFVFGQALNDHDVEGMGRCWLEEGNFVDQWGRLAVGRAGMQGLFETEFAGELAGSRFKATRLELRVLSNDVVVGECDAVFENVKAPNGRSYDLPHRIDAVFVRREGRWLFMSAHPSLRRA